MAEATAEAAPVESAAADTETAAKPKRKRRIKWRKVLRAVHRDIGYLAVGFTFIYAISGIAVNHIADLGDTSFTQIEKTVPLDFDLPADPKAAASVVAEKLDIDGELVDAYQATDTQLILTYEQMTADIDTASKTVFLNGQEPRFFLRIANWLHVHRQTTAWTYIADAYAIMLLYLAISGMFMIAGRKGLFGRGGLLVAVGIAIPIVFVVASGGPTG